MKTLAKPHICFGMRWGVLRILFLGILITNNISQSSAGVAKIASAAEAMNTVADGAEKLTSTISKMANVLIGPAINALQNKIDRMNIDIEQLEDEEKKRVKDAINKSLKVKDEMLHLKASLNSLALETLRETRRLILVLETIKLNDISTEEVFNKKIRKKIGFLTKSMARLLERSESELDNAKIKYDAIQADLRKIETDLKFFKQRINSIMKNENGEFTTWENKMRAIVYGSSTACLASVIFAPIVCAGTYATAATTLETVIAVYKATLNELLNQCKASLKSITPILVDVQKNGRWINEEVSLITTWRGAVKSMAGQFESGDVLIERIEIIFESTKPTIDMLTNLADACNAYVEHQAPE